MVAYSVARNVNPQSATSKRLISPSLSMRSLGSSWPAGSSCFPWGGHGYITKHLLLDVFKVTAGCINAKSSSVCLLEEMITVAWKIKAGSSILLANW